MLALLGPRVPVSLKIFLTALAIIDDLGAVAIIAVFYASDLAPVWLGLAAAALIVLAALNQLGVDRLSPYLIVGAILWCLRIEIGRPCDARRGSARDDCPLRRSPGHPDDTNSPLHGLEHALHGWVAFMIVPLFGFANAGVSFSGMSWAAAATPVTLGIAAGLFAGKQIGVFLTSWAAVASGVADRPAGASWAQIYGVSLLCGIGFTMSLFIGLLAFPASPELQDQVKVGVLMGSLLSGMVGALVLLLARGEKRRPTA